MAIEVLAHRFDLAASDGNGRPELNLAYDRELGARRSLGATLRAGETQTWNALIGEARVPPSDIAPAPGLWPLSVQQLRWIAAESELFTPSERDRFLAGLAKHPPRIHVAPSPSRRETIFSPSDQPGDAHVMLAAGAVYVGSRLHVDEPRSFTYPDLHLRFRLFFE
jgi:hypothetical protein